MDHFNTRLLLKVIMTLWILEMNYKIETILIYHEKELREE